jgi:aryl-alcohol dehydrogenase-like predicted oxidoreductase
MISKNFKNNQNNIANKLILGTVQFGKSYGISNTQNKKVNTRHQKKIFNLCKKFGINEIDTAYEYDFDINTLPKSHKWLVNTKIKIDTFSTEKKIINYLKSFKKKNLILNCVYIHDEENLFTKRGKFVFNVLSKCRTKNLFNKIGVSIYNLSNIKFIIKNFKINVIQVPFNILHTEIRKYKKILKKKDVTIHARSIFLQGLLLMKPHLLPKKFLIIKKYILMINKKKNFFKTTLVNYLLNFVDKEECISKILFGVHSYEHLKEIVNYKRISKIDFNNFRLANRKITDPRTW